MFVAQGRKNSHIVHLDAGGDRSRSSKAAQLKPLHKRRHESVVKNVKHGRTPANKETDRVESEEL